MVAAIVLLPTHAKVGDTVLITGTGFTGTDTISFTFGGAGITPTDAPIVCVAGAFTAHIVIPASTKGNHTVNAADTHAGSANATFATDTNLVIDPVDGPSGATITLIGTGYAGTSAVTLTFDGVGISPVSAITSNGSGGFTASLIIPTALTLAAHTIVATDAATNTASGTYTVDELQNTAITYLNAGRSATKPSGMIRETVPVGGSTVYNTIAVIPFYNFTDALIELLNTDEANTLTYTVFGSADYNNGTAPDPTAESWSSIAAYADKDIAPDATAIITITKPNLWSWILIQAKPKVANSDGVLEVYGRFIN